MIDDLRKKGKPVTPKVEEMALWLDSLDTSSLDDGQVGMPVPSKYCSPLCPCPLWSCKAGVEQSAGALKRFDTSSWARGCSLCRWRW